MKPKIYDNFSISVLTLFALILFGATTFLAQTPTLRTNGKIAFASNRDGNYEIYSMDNDGSSQIRLTNNPAADSRPAWSPDGRRIAFQSTRAGNTQIYVMNTDGSSQTRLTNNSADDYAPQWSPDGTKIVFSESQSQSPYSEIYVIDADGSNPTNLTNSPNLFRILRRGRPMTAKSYSCAGHITTFA